MTFDNGTLKPAISLWLTNENNNTIHITTRKQIRIAVETLELNMNITKPLHVAT